MKFENEIIFEKYSNYILNEGGAAGHMMHPFDLPNVQTFDDILSTFNNAVQKLEKGSATIKLDGVNLSLKVIDSDIPNKKQFALDRGSQKEIDVNGITINDLSNRFSNIDGKKHPMVNKGETILKIMNDALPSIKEELIGLGMYNDPSKFLNTEYIQGKENAIDYSSFLEKSNIIAFHGVNQFVEKYDRKGNITRPSPLKPRQRKNPNTGKEEIIKETSRKVPVDPGLMDNLREKIKPFAQEYGFDVVTSIYVTKKGFVDFNIPLNKPFVVKYTNDEKKSLPLKQWLKGDLPKAERVEYLNGKIKGAISKDVYMDVFNSNKPLSEIFKEQSIDPAVRGALTYHLTRVLGNEVLKNFTTNNYGDANNHEGIVLSDKEYGSDEFGNINSIKITGDFIVDGMGGNLSDRGKKDEDDQSAPAINYGGGKMDFSSYFSNPRSQKDPGGSGFKSKFTKQ